MFIYVKSHLAFNVAQNVSGPERPERSRRGEGSIQFSNNSFLYNIDQLV